MNIKHEKLKKSSSEWIPDEYPTEEIKIIQRFLMKRMNKHPERKLVLFAAAESIKNCRSILVQEFIFGIVGDK